MRSAVQKSYQEESFLPDDIEEKPKSTPPRRLHALDGVRGLAVIEVFLYHARTPHKNSGWIGVELFLALSGFVITRSLLSEWFQTGSISVRNFLKRRALRIYPALIFLIISYTVISFLVFKRTPQRIFSEVVPSLFGFANWTRAFNFPIPKDLGHLWSLSVELQLYLVWAPIIIWNLRRSPKNLIPGILIIALSCSLYRSYLISIGESGTFIYNNSICRALPFVFGSIAAALAAYNFTPGRFSKTFKTVGILIFLSALAYHFYELRYCSLSQWGRRNWNPLFISLSSAIIVWGISLRIIPAIGKIFSSRALNYLGNISYGTFLWHYPLLMLFPRAYSDYRFFCAAALSLVLGAISFELVEKRFLRKY